jgi:probable F420-dependent oxidoreductase
MEFGLQLALDDWAQLRDVAQAAEKLGFKAIYFPDHLLSEGPERQAMGRPAHDPMVQIAVVAEATRRIRVGPLVLCNLFRHPAVTARSFATLDELSGGRLIAGLGTGWTETEFRMTGIAFPDIGTRLRMLDEALTCIRGIWNEKPFSFRGEFYTFQDAALVPKPVQRPYPPFLLGGGGRGLLRVAAKHADAVNIVAETGRPGYISLAYAARLTDETFQEKVRFLRSEAKRHGRDGNAIRISQVAFTAAVTDSPAATATMAEGMAGMFGGSPEAVLRSPLFLVGTPEECVAELRRREQVWGVNETIFAFPGEHVMRRLGEEILPKLR